MYRRTRKEPHVAIPNPTTKSTIAKSTTCCGSRRQTINAEIRRTIHLRCARRRSGDIHKPNSIIAFAASRSVAQGRYASRARVRMRGGCMSAVLAPHHHPAPPLGDHDWTMERCPNCGGLMARTSHLAIAREWLVTLQSGRSAYAPDQRLAEGRQRELAVAGRIAAPASK